jgi:hypothetical protein
MHRVTLPIICLVFVLLTSNTTARKWTDTTGRFSIEASFVEVKNGNAVLKKTDGETISVPLAKLSKEDRDFVREVVTGKPMKERERTSGGPEKSGLNVVGFFVSPTLSRSTDTIAPRSPKNVFLVVVVEVPNKRLMPDEREYRSLAKKLDSNKPREHITELDPEAYRIYLGTNRVGKKGVHISEWDDTGKGDFANWSATTAKEPVDPNGTETIAIGWMLPKSVCRPPFKLKFKNYEQDAVPEKDPRDPAG